MPQFVYIYADCSDISQKQNLTLEAALLDRNKGFIFQINGGAQHNSPRFLFKLIEQSFQGEFPSSPHLNCKAKKRGACWMLPRWPQLRVLSPCGFQHPKLGIIIYKRMWEQGHPGFSGIQEQPREVLLPEKRRLGRRPRDTAA